MGSPATPSPADRAAIRDLSARIVRSVEEDAAMPLGIDSETFGKVEAFTQDDVETLAMKMAQEIVALREESGRLFRALDTALTLSDCPEHMQNDDWQRDRAECGRVCDEYVGFKGETT